MVYPANYPRHEGIHHERAVVPSRLSMRSVLNGRFSKWLGRSSSQAASHSSAWWRFDVHLTPSGRCLLAEVARSGTPVVLASVATGHLAAVSRSLAIEYAFCGCLGQCRLAPAESCDDLGDRLPALGCVGQVSGAGRCRLVG